MKLKQDSMPLSYTPRKFITHPTNNYFYMIEGDHRVMGEAATSKKLQELVSSIIFIGYLSADLYRLAASTRQAYRRRSHKSTIRGLWATKGACRYMGLMYPYHRPCGSQDRKRNRAGRQRSCFLADYRSICGAGRGVAPSRRHGRRYTNFATLMYEWLPANIQVHRGWHGFGIST